MVGKRPKPNKTHAIEARVLEAQFLAGDMLAPFACAEHWQDEDLPPETLPPWVLEHLTAVAAKYVKQGRAARSRGKKTESLEKVAGLSGVQKKTGAWSYGEKLERAWDFNQALADEDGDFPDWEFTWGDPGKGFIEVTLPEDVDVHYTAAGNNLVGNNDVGAWIGNNDVLSVFDSRAKMLFRGSQFNSWWGHQGQIPSRVTAGDGSSFQPGMLGIFWVGNDSYGHTNGVKDGRRQLGWRLPRRHIGRG